MYSASTRDDINLLHTECNIKGTVHQKSTCTFPSSYYL